MCCSGCRELKMRATPQRQSLAPFLQSAAAEELEGVPMQVAAQRVRAGS
jgi:hypothetical protein